LLWDEREGIKLSVDGPISRVLRQHESILHVVTASQDKQMTNPDTLEKSALRMPTIDPGVRIGHVHLKVADLQRALDFYCGVLGFTLTTSRPGAAFISAGGYHHHLGLNTWESLGGSPPAPGTTGLYHTAILYPTRRLLADALRRLIVAKIPLEGASDHGVSEALYLRDPDDNGVELYWDRPKEKWPKKPDGSLQMFTHPLDLHDLLAELDKPGA
jgi:catechol 2,3-dioxygenase